MGDRVVLNTTAVDLGLGTGGWHVVHWNTAREVFEDPGPGHIMKLRYTSLQVDAGSTEEHDAGTAHRPRRHAGGGGQPPQPGARRGGGHPGRASRTPGSPT